MQQFVANRLSVNVKKTCFMIFGNQAVLNKLKSVDLMLNNMRIEQTKSSKFLGVLIDDQLNWKCHINYICNKLAKNIGVIRKLRYRFPMDVLLTLYNTLLLPYLTYCNIIWANNKPTRLKHLIVIQKRAVRIVTNSNYYEHSLPLFFKCNLLNLQDINKLCTATFMYRFHNNQLPKTFSLFYVLNSDVHEHFTRQSNKLHINYARTDILKHHLRIYGAKIWNAIEPDIISSAHHLYSFKKKFKAHLLSFYKY